MSVIKGRKPTFPPMVPSIPEEELIEKINEKGVVETAKEFGCSRQTIWRWLATNHYISQYVKQGERAS